MQEGAIEEWEKQIGLRNVEYSTFLEVVNKQRHVIPGHIGEHNMRAIWDTLELNEAQFEEKFTVFDSYFRHELVKPEDTGLYDLGQIKKLGFMLCKHTDKVNATTDELWDLILHNSAVLNDPEEQNDDHMVGVS